MDRMHEEDDMFRPPRYFVNSFSCSVHDDNSQLEVRRYGKCFYIIMAPENFVESPLVKQQYLDYLAAERSDAINNGNMAEEYNPEDFYTWALKPCLPLFETVALAPAPKQNHRITLHDFLHPDVFYYSLRAVNGELAPVEYQGRGAGMLAPGLELDDSAFSPAWPSFLPTDIECGYLTLACAVESDTPSSTKQKWVNQVTATLTQLHKAGIVWGDAKPDNTLIDKDDNAWIIDFGGGYTQGFVEREKAGTIEGDM